MKGTFFICQMPTIYLTTNIAAPVNRVFDLSRSIDLHTISMAHTSERPVAGVTSGLIKQGDVVQWQAKHLFKTRFLTTRITKMDLYASFTDKMIEGDFQIMEHEHLFTYFHNTTIMKDVFHFRSPFGAFGYLVDLLFLKWYMKRLLEKRNQIIKEYAETDKWQVVLCVE